MWDHEQYLSGSSHALKITWNQLLFHWIGVRNIEAHHKGLDQDLDGLFASLNHKVISMLGEEGSFGICPKSVAKLKGYWKDVLERLHRLGYLVLPYEIQETQRFTIKLEELMKKVVIFHCLSVYPKLIESSGQFRETDEDRPRGAKRHRGD